MSETPQAVTFAGIDQKGNPLFDMAVSVPDPLPFDSPCTDRQSAAVVNFYCSDFDGGLTFSQAHSLLSYRQYATACAEYLFNGHSQKYILLFGRLIAAYISSRESIARYAVSRSNRRFSVGSEVAYVARSKWFSEIALFCDEQRLELGRHHIIL